MAMNFQYEIFVNGNPMDSRPTSSGALALVSLRWHGVPNVEIWRRGALIWKAKV